jgi:hypothetical protein
MRTGNGKLRAAAKRNEKPQGHPTVVTASAQLKVISRYVTET